MYKRRKVKKSRKVGKQKRRKVKKQETRKN